MRVTTAWCMRRSSPALRLKRNRIAKASVHSAKPRLEVSIIVPFSYGAFTEAYNFQMNTSRKQISIPGYLEWEVRDGLDQSNITERVLFPGLDGMCSGLSRRYFPGANETGR